MLLIKLKYLKVWMIKTNFNYLFVYFILGNYKDEHTNQHSYLSNANSFTILPFEIVIIVVITTLSNL